MQEKIFFEHLPILGKILEHTMEGFGFLLCVFSMIILLLILIKIILDYFNY